MSRVALFRGVNVGGSRILNMARLRELFTTELHAQAVKTYIQSGNCLYIPPTECPPEHQEQLRIMRAVEKEFGFDVEGTVVRSVDEIREVVADNPLIAELRDEGITFDPKKMVVFFVYTSKPKSVPVTVSGKVLSAARFLAESATTKERLAFHKSGRHLYMYHPNGIGASKFPFKKFETLLGYSVTVRNWNTVTKLIEIGEEVEKELSGAGNSEKGKRKRAVQTEEDGEGNEHVESSAKPAAGNSKRGKRKRAVQTGEDGEGDEHLVSLAKPSKRGRRKI
ncbi:DUF1697-domain-containing protein [Gonapodya prolifera JEL478]|uniref:DUF1697-domain-containing protein n=1 Tax=Gonapodya prolifera (strain JEL478) TaxID=1344416 RepID=A0A139AX81_GONPJ|nr:DUF1697-domain-containing protein [Gonapodya prolifera JEL478]|eukprot:KXS21314.1 DUF1697-domain-containing protein [Gonapodya prolifera JEL478]